MNQNDQILSFSNLHLIIKGRSVQSGEDLPINEIFIDSRKPIIAYGSTFIALKGNRHDGHDYLQSLYNQGIRNFIIQSESKQEGLSEANIFRVYDTGSALQELARWKRGHFSSSLKEVVAITGSNGKTIIKEWLSIILESKYSVVKNPGSYNSQVGVPLSVWKIDSEHNFGIFEAGISKTGEMEKLEKIIQPTIGIFTNIGPAHDQGFSSRLEKAEEKSMLFKNCNTVIYPSEYREINTALNELAKSNQTQLLDWSTHENSTFQLLEKDKNLISVKYEDKIFEFSPPFSDSASLENLIHCICTLLFLGFNEKTISEGFLLLEPVKMRLQLKRAKNNNYIIDDTYNNDLSALEIALDFLISQKQKRVHRVILSDILQSSESDEKLYKKISDLLESKRIDCFIGIGESLSRNKDLFSTPSEFFNATDDFLKQLDHTEFTDEVILIKGARNFRFEKIVDALQDKTHDTELIINLSALTHNLNFYRSQIDQKTKIMVMVKAFAYGSGSLEVANLLQYHKVDYLAVAYTDEAVFLRQNGIHLPIMVMNSHEDQFGLMKRYQLEPEIFSFKMLNTLIDFSKENGPLNFHLKIDSGMNRLGFLESEIDELCELLKADSQDLKVKTIFTHLAASDDVAENDFSKSQVELFLRLSEKIEATLGYRIIKHALNSPGIIQLPDYHLDMVRLGIGLYGIDTTGKRQNHLQPIGTLKSRIAQVKNVKAGQTVGYSRMGKVNVDKTIAVVNIGYADGYDRRFSNGVGKMMIKGKSAPVIGNICMDMTMIDVTNIDVEEDDEVIIFSPDFSILNHAKEIGTIPYELLTNVGQRIKRVFVNE
ncbi:MAG: bifunctional UDP-N-acetylmuramoyl-tripeptide:D-alanyl-D-alanine ligase/alanine racemase [Bacteroidota bacterium]